MNAPGTPAPSEVPDGPTVSVSVNGEARRIPGGLTLDRLVATLSRASAGVAAAVNETVVPRSQWPGTALGDGDRVEVLTAVQGG
ncbi:sulfur carrier protein ThiS [Streptomyces sp. NPDC056149]|uniref:sulfur carrier protein ThiS n=1 Tax=unclassified Streptomyces TaxID=2593676 RepID=UPI002380E56A|nr:sulfur carrier protein ThiS [Streptomyces sp. WZ-12]